MNSKIEEFFKNEKRWNAEFLLLREIIRENEALAEDFKWMHPCYTLGSKNIVLIHGFKEYCALLFHKGSLLTDPHQILVQQTPNVQAARQLRFTNTEQIILQASIIQAYIAQAILIEQSGKKVTLKKAIDYPVPPEFERALQQDNELKEAFSALTPGRQKGYLFYFHQAKQSQTREKRIEKYYEKILKGMGLDD
ncbi:YdeI family protein [Sphingobacterium sp. JB170]|uniref:YdeI/OmpD-associated family protein n=1 Tax=Sphingobacterium sp. JB170 TaxID=1434842 RepID=UPI00097F21C5|nr:YdeI/OmpD-associated family protein [Sphingobacterium sp. JB170]SJN47567.1 DUF1801 domain-containing protein [Sphingobacterium sp. JB170]